ncbi:MAG: 2-amino-4-hydroxy-6-hydroxymethyldihydropteridine diphosphokinase [Mediterranea sp.]|jgi:2-amino-4-hydroxy-6-hydroxymethyldihydropteridine diphosphokinase|nr:2-amino-4-hydroxy-6-hydroxymethyldihydropteridine diphosphokinase [Mediterranea sp.]
MACVYLGLGTNLGNQEQNLYDAVQKIEKRIGEKLSLSAFYITAPWGFASGNDFLNAVINIDSPLLPLVILKETQMIELEMGRKKEKQEIDESTTGGRVYHDRLIDIDLLLYDNLIMTTKELTLPHPLMTERIFVMKPLVEIAPEVVHPVFGRTMLDILSSLTSL